VPLELPNLDDMTWQQLAELGRASIPGWAPEWTNHNAADPGITLVELFAYLTEILIYRVNRISAANMWAFLRLINGPDWDARLRESLEEAKRTTLKNRLAIERAVTPRDFENLALAAHAVSDSGTTEKVARAKAIFRRRLDPGDPGSAVTDAPGFVSVIVVADAEHGAAEPSAGLLEAVRQKLETARLLATRIRVVGPRCLSFGVHATLVISTTMNLEEAHREAIKVLTTFFDPLKGGPREEGWPFGRSIYVSEVYELLARLPGVKLVKRSTDAATRRTMEELAVLPSEASRRRLNQDGKLEAIHLDADELVLLEIRAQDITVVHEGQGHEYARD
jgi:hypothetical protein